MVLFYFSNSKVYKAPLSIKLKVGLTLMFDHKITAKEKKGRIERKKKENQYYYQQRHA
jgi:hypothetical protein